MVLVLSLITSSSHAIFGSRECLLAIDNAVIPSPTTKNTRYGALFPWNCEINPAVIGPTAHPIPKVVSYAPMIVPEISFLVFDRMVFNVSGKNILNPKPISSKAIANSTIESETNAISNPKAMDRVAAISV